MTNNKTNQWDLSPLAISDDDPQLYKKRQRSIVAVSEFRKKWMRNQRYLSDAEQLRIALDELELIERDHGINSWEWYYFSLRSAQDQLDPKLKSKYRSADELTTKLYNQLQFFGLSIADVSKDKQDAFLSDESLAPYRHYLERLFAFKPYQLSEPEEKIANLVEASSRGAWISMTSSFLSKVQENTLDENGHVVEKSFSEILSLTSSSDKNVRDAAATHVHAITQQHAGIATEEINAILHYKKVMDELRGYTRPDQSRHIGDDINSEVVDTLVNQVGARFDIPRRYYQLKAKLMGKKRLEYHERNVPYGQIDLSYSYDDSTKMVEHTLEQLDQEFATIFKSFLAHGQLDVYPRKGKSGGAFCAHNLLTQPTYILLNHTDKLQDVLTLAHEVGHGIHNELARKKQNAFNFGTSLATAEVASTFMEDFVLEGLRKDADQKTQLAIGMMKLNDDISSIFRQIACYMFESELHQKFQKTGYLSTEEIGEIFTRNMAEYMGEAVQQDEGSQNWWVYWSHIRNFFYVYSYASGLLISKSLQSIVRSDATNVAKVKQFMAAGQSMSPQNIFKSIDIDITSGKFWDKGLDEIDEHLSAVEELASRQ